MKKGEAVTFKSIDSAMEEFGNMALPPQFYHTQTPTGMPPHELKLKEGCIVILLRNIDVSLGLCNGTRLRVDKIRKDQNVRIEFDLKNRFQVLVCTRLTSEKTPDYGAPGYEERAVILTRLPMQPADKSDPSLRFTRMQFPIRLAYSLTINKAQGQTLRKVLKTIQQEIHSSGGTSPSQATVRPWTALCGPLTSLFIQWSPCLPKRQQEEPAKPARCSNSQCCVPRCPQVNILCIHTINDDGSVNVCTKFFCIE